MNDRVSRDARGSCADYLGSFRVSPDESYLNQSQGVSAKEGLWLVWKFEGDCTLAQYMAQPDYPTGIARHLLPDKDGDKSLRGDPAVELEVTQAAMKRATNLKTPTKPALVQGHQAAQPRPDRHGRRGEVQARPSRRARFRTGMNFAPDETIMGSEALPLLGGVFDPFDDATTEPQALRPGGARRGSAAWLQQ